MDNIGQLAIARKFAELQNKVADNEDKITNMTTFNFYEMPYLRGMYLDIYNDIQVLKQNISGIHTTLDSELTKLAQKTDLTLDLSDLHLELPSLDAPVAPPQMTLSALSSRVISLENALQDIKSKTANSAVAPLTVPDSSISHRLDVLEHLQTVHTSQITRIDNEHVGLAAKVDGTTPSTDIPLIALLQRDVEQLRLGLADKVDKSEIPTDIITLSTFTEIADMNFLANKVADVLTARLGCRARLASSLINAASHVQEAAQNGISDFLRDTMNDMEKMSPGVYDFEGDAKAKFGSFLRYMSDRINQLTAFHGHAVDQIIKPDDSAPDSPPSRTRRQVPETVMITLQQVQQIKRMYDDWKNSYDTYWFSRLKYLDTERVKNYLMAGGILDNWLTLFSNMQEKLEAISDQQSQVEVHKTMDFYDDVPRFLGRPKSSTGGKFSTIP